MAKGVYPRTHSSMGMLGKKHTVETRLKMSESHKGNSYAKDKNLNEQNHKWKGNTVGYRALHYWIRRKLGIPDKCMNCLKSGGNPKQYHWANIDHTYKRLITDWIYLCASCHSKYDNEKITINYE